MWFFMCDLLWEYKKFLSSCSVPQWCPHGRLLQDIGWIALQIESRTNVQRNDPNY